MVRKDISEVLIDRGSTHGESQERQPFGIHGHREFHEGFPPSSGSFTVPVTGVVTGEPRCINRNLGTNRVRRKRHLGKVVDQRGKKAGG